jgi:hypothetical protein
MLWRRLAADGTFSEYGGRRIIEAETNARGTVRVHGIPGEFRLVEVEPGVYALDSAFALIRDGPVNYIANGVIEGPERPAFEARPGEAVYLGIWQMDIEETHAVARPWRLSEADLVSVLRASNELVGNVRMRETHTRAVACAPQRLNNLTQRQIC